MYLWKVFTCELINALSWIGSIFSVFFVCRLIRLMVLLVHCSEQSWAPSWASAPPLFQPLWWNPVPCWPHPASPGYSLRAFTWNPLSQTSCFLLWAPLLLHSSGSQKCTLIFATSKCGGIYNVWLLPPLMKKVWGQWNFFLLPSSGYLESSQNISRDRVIQHIEGSKLGYVSLHWLLLLIYIPSSVTHSCCLGSHFQMNYLHMDPGLRLCLKTTSIGQSYMIFACKI